MPMTAPRPPNPSAVDLAGATPRVAALARKAPGAALAASAAAAATGWPADLLDSLPVGLLTVDRRLMVRSANAHGRRLLGVERQGAALGRRLLDGLGEGDRQRLRVALAGPSGAERQDDTGMSCGEVRFETADGTPRVLRVEASGHNRHGETVLACFDVTTARAEAEHARHRADHDALTGLPNRAAIMARLDEALQQARAASRQVAVLFIDLDHFKSVNDTHGHAAGDHVLREVATRLRDAIGDTGVVSRLGGDEFLALLPWLADDTGVPALAEAAARALARPIAIRGKPWQTTASIGLSIFPQHGADSGTLLRSADLALYRVKREGRNGVRIFDPARDHPADPTAAQAALVPAAVIDDPAAGVGLDDLRAALARHEFELHYQPQRCLRSGSIVGMGARVRWRHPRLGLLDPQALVSRPDACEVLDELDGWTLSTAVRQLRRWHRAGLKALRLSVAPSPRLIGQPGFETAVGELLQRTRLAPGRLLLQVPEGTLLQAAPTQFEQLGTLRQRGAGLALDRFGAGASSLGLLARLRPDCVRIDGSIVGALPAAAACALVQATVALARPLALRVLADGVQTHTQHGMLAAMGVDEGEGPLSGEPLPALQATALLRADLAPA